VSATNDFAGPARNFRRRAPLESAGSGAPLMMGGRLFCARAGRADRELAGKEDEYVFFQMNANTRAAGGGDAKIN